MQISVQIPERLASVVEGFHSWCLSAYENVVESSSLARASFDSQQNAYWWLLISIVLFWPFWVYFAIALTTASAWIFWLLTSICLGVLQVVYVTYQFIMITINVVLLTLLKTYQVLMRSHLFNTIFFFSSTIRNSHKRTSRRREWERQCDRAKSFADYLRISKLEPKSACAQGRDSKRDAALPPASPKRAKTMEEPVGGIKSKLRRRTRSYGTLPVLKEATEVLNSSPELNRVSSFGRLDAADKSVDETDSDPEIREDIGPMTHALLVSTITRLEEARQACQSDGDISLQYLLSGVVKRNHLQLEDLLVNNARSVAVAGQHLFSKPTRNLIAQYYSEVSRGLTCMSDAPVSNPTASLTELKDRITLARKMKQNMGRTALLCSGGGAISMFHLGTIRALIDGGLYDGIKVISGTSGGSITAAMCALKTGDELFQHVCLPTVSTDYLLSGEMKKRAIRWFPRLTDMAAYWLKHGLLVDSALFRECCEFYYSDYTFAEAFKMTGKHVCITVSASRASGMTVQRLLLNHISTPHVTLASAVAASCALPGVMAPAKLQIKNRAGELEPFEIDGVEWIDGSVQADLPFQRISTLFNVSNYIVCQTNFHVQPFLNKSHHPSTRSLYWRFFQTVEWDIRSRALKLSKLGLFPRIFGQDISKVFKQKYHGNVTLVPRFTAMQAFGLKALSNPTVKDMEGYLKYGQMAAWPFLGVIRDMIRLEQDLDCCLESLHSRCRKMYPELESGSDEDVESIASDSASVSNSVRERTVRIFGHDKDLDRLQRQLFKVEQENVSLRHQVEKLQALIRDKDRKGIENQTDEEKKQDFSDAKITQLSEGNVRNLVQKLSFIDAQHELKALHPAQHTS